MKIAKTSVTGKLKNQRNTLTLQNYTMLARMLLYVYWWYELCFKKQLSLSMWYPQHYSEIVKSLGIPNCGIQSSQIVTKTYNKTYAHNICLLLALNSRWLSFLLKLLLPLPSAVFFLKLCHVLMKILYRGDYTINILTLHTEKNCNNLMTTMRFGPNHSRCPLMLR